VKRNQVITVAGFTFRDAVRKKAFWITNIIYVILVLAAALLLPRMGGFGGDMSMDIGGGAGLHLGAQCFLLDESEDPMLKGAEEALISAGMRVTLINADELENTLDEVRERGDAAIVHLLNEPLPQAIVTTRDMMSGFPVGAVNEILNQTYRLNQFAEVGYDIDITRNILMSGVAVGAMQLQDIADFVMGIALMALMFMSIYVYGYGVAMSVAMEKSTRVMETLIVSAKPSRILVGKCIGMGAAGLSQLVGVLLFAAAAMQLLMPAGSLDDFGMPDLDFIKIALLVLYFLLGFSLFAMVNSICGAMVSKMEDLNSAMMPPAIISMLSFYGGYIPVVSGGAVNRLVMLIPFTAPFAAPSVLLTSEFDPALIAASLGILLAAIAVVGWISSRVYSASVLRYGGRVKFSDLGRMIRGK